MVHFIGAGPGDPELLTIKGKKLIDQADVIIYAGSLVNKEVLAGAKEGAEICTGCQSPQRICCNYVVSARQRHKNRINVIIVGEELGY